LPTAKFLRAEQILKRFTIDATLDQQLCPRPFCSRDCALSAYPLHERRQLEDKLQQPGGLQGRFFNAGIL
jgi:hypothetical protein